MNVTWTDRPDGRQFWTWDAQKDEWVKTVFVTWGELKSPKGFASDLKFPKV